MSPRADDEKTEIKSFPNAETYPCLEILASPRGRGRHPLKEGKNTIGRSRDSDVILDDSSVSRHHAEIEITNGTAVIRDLGSRNGTKVAGRKIEDPTPLAQDVRVKVGAFQARYLTGPAPEVVEEAPEVPEESPVEEAPVSVQTTGEHQAGDLPPESVYVDEGAPPPRAKRSLRPFFLFGSLIVVFLAAVVLAGPQMMKWIKGDKKPAVVSEKKKIEKPMATSALPIKEKETTPPVKKEGPQPVFLEFAANPIPADIFFGDEKIGTTPLRTSTNLVVGKWYEAKAFFQLPEVGEVIEERAQFTLPSGASIIPVNFSGRIGVFKVSALPRDANLYLEGYFEKDPYRAKPIKFSEIVFGKPVYVPFGRYIVELRKSRQLGNSQTFLDEVVYRREFNINKDHPNHSLDVSEDALAVFPVELTSVPPAARVFIDQKEVGTTPYKGTFPVGEHLLTLKHEGYFDFVQMIKMAMNMPYVSEIQMKTSEAGDLINRGDALLREGRFAEALPVLVEAYTKNPSPRETAQISYFIGICYLRQKALKEAQDYFLKAMTQEDYKYAARVGLAGVTLEQGNSIQALQMLVEVLMSSEDPKVRADAGALFQRISPLKSVMYITSEPAGAKVWVNGTEVGQLTPMILHDLGVGAYAIQIQKEGYETTEMKLNLGVSEFRPLVAKLRRPGAPQ